MPSPFSAPIGAFPIVRIGRRVARIALFAMLASHNAFGAESSLTMAEARRLAIAHSRLLAAQDFAVSASRDMAVAARQLPDPVLKAGIDNLPVSGAGRFSFTDDFMTMRRIGVSQEFTRADKRDLRARRFEREAEKSLAQKDVTAAAIERDTTIAWLDRYYAEMMAQVIAAQVAQAKVEIGAAEGAYRAGRGSQADVLAARSALADFENRASEARQRIRNSTTALTRWIGAAAAMPLAGRPMTDTIRLDPATLGTALAHHPEVAVSTKQQEIAQADAQLARANLRSDWTVEVSYQQRGSAYANMISVGVSIPLQWDRDKRQNRELSSRLAVAEQATAEREEMLRAHIAETTAMVNEWESDRERSARYEGELIPLAQQRAAATIAAYRGGKASLADVLAARRNEIDVRLQALRLESDTARVWAQLNFLFPETSSAARPMTMTHKENNAK